MSTEIRVPTLGESVTEATVGRWFKKPGDAVKADEPLLELETDKVTLEVNAPAAGALAEIVAKDGETVTPGALLGHIAEGAVTAVAVTAAAAAPPPASTPAAPAGAAPPPSPAAAKNAADLGVSVGDVPGSGKRGQVLKGDVLAFAAAP
ncbi:biotin/lipoyl-containing protein, partial [Rhodoblastus sp.]|uniref:biotin/lipoyl-containing protein n=1 Tax=Rhodoblastus sp. TaxID=1962975 RepID=UPI002639FA1B